MSYSIKPFGPLKRLSKASKRKLELFNFMLNGKETSSIVDADLRSRTMEALLNQDASSIVNVGDHLSKYVLSFLSSKVREGMTVEEACSALQLLDSKALGPFARARHSVSLIAKTELSRARQQAIFDYYSSKGGFQYYVWLSVRANNTCERCAERHNKYKKLSTWAELGTPPLHCGCKCSLVPGYSLREDIEVES